VPWNWRRKPRWHHPEAELPDGCDRCELSLQLGGPGRREILIFCKSPTNSKPRHRPGLFRYRSPRVAVRSHARAVDAIRVGGIDLSRRQRVRDQELPPLRAGQGSSARLRRLPASSPLSDAVCASRAVLPPRQRPGNLPAPARVGGLLRPVADQICCAHATLAQKMSVNMPGDAIPYRENTRLRLGLRTARIF
jgi:hypothetical protein